MAGAPSGNAAQNAIQAAFANPNTIAIPIPSRGQLDAFNVNREGWEAITQGLYDSGVYPAAGVTQLSFFQTPQGQGTGFAGGAKTLEDTNMTNAGVLPANQEFLIQSVEVNFEPATPTVALGMPAAVDVAASLAVQINEAYIFYRTGYLVLFIGAKNYLNEAPILKFPPKAYFKLDAATALGNTAQAANVASNIAFATARGRPYLLKAPLRLVSQQNFSVTLNWPTLRAITNPALVYVTLDGVFYRRSQ